MSLPNESDLLLAHSVSDSSPDRAIILGLCHEAFPQYTINVDLLINWLTELSDVARDVQLLESAVVLDVVLLFPESTVSFSSEHCDAIMNCIENLDALEDEIFLDLKLILYQVILRVTTSLDSTKFNLSRLGLGEFLVKNYRDYAIGISERRHDDESLVTAFKKKLVLSFLDASCGVEELKAMYLPLFQSSTRYSLASKRLIIQLIKEFMNTTPSQFPQVIFKNFLTTATVFSFKMEGHARRFSVAGWFKLQSAYTNIIESQEQMHIPLILLASSSKPELTFKVEIHYRKFHVILRDAATRAATRLTFNYFASLNNNINQGFSHFAITYDKRQNMSLYIDGQFTESIPYPALSKSEVSWNKIYIGQSPEDHDGIINIFDRNELVLRNLLVFDCAIDPAWLCFLYDLGVGRELLHFNYSDANISGLFHLMNASRSFHLGLSLIASKLSSQQKLSFSKGSSTSVSSELSVGSDGNPLDEKDILRVLQKKKPSHDQVLFDMNEVEYLNSLDFLTTVDVVYSEPQSYYSSLYSWGGAGILISLIETCIKDNRIETFDRDQFFFCTIDLLFAHLEKDWRLLKDFKNIDGYWILGLIIQHYKERFNPELVLRNTDTVEDGETFPQQNSLLSMIFLYSIHKDTVNRGIVVRDFEACKTLLINLDIFNTEDNLNVLNFLVSEILGDDYARLRNTQILNKSRYLKKVLQFMRGQILERRTHAPVTVDTISAMLESALDVDASIDSVKSISQFISFALYQNADNIEAHSYGAATLLRLTDKLCGADCSMKLLRKFSSSISIHWILLLLEFNSTDKAITRSIVTLGLALLVKLLHTLGPHLTKKFFVANSGIDVLTNILSSHWNNDAVISSLLLASLGVYSKALIVHNLTVTQLLKDERLRKRLTGSVHPEFLIILNNLALTGMSILGQEEGRVLSTPSSPKRPQTSEKLLDGPTSSELSLDILHLVSQLSHIIKEGYATRSQLHTCLESKSWLEGAFEMVGHLKLMCFGSKEKSGLPLEFSSHVDNFIADLSQNFIAKLLEVKEITRIINSVSDMTTRIILATVFPKIFAHTYEFLRDPSFVFKEEELVSSSVELLEIYHAKVIMQNYLVEDGDLNCVMDCVTAILETKKLSDSSKMRLGPIFSHLIITKFSNLASEMLRDTRIDSLDHMYGSKFDELLKFCLYKQTLIFDPKIVTKERISHILELIMGINLRFQTQNQVHISEYYFNFLRSVVMMKRPSLPSIVSQIIATSDYENAQNVVMDFFVNLETRNDDDMMKYILKSSTLKHVIQSRFQYRITKLNSLESMRLWDMIKIVLHNGGILNNVDHDKIRKFTTDCKSYMNMTLKSEALKYERELQDKKENLLFSSSLYDNMRFEIRRYIAEKESSFNNYTLDYIEGGDRMRKLLVVENQLPESEKLTYTVNVPTKQGGNTVLLNVGESLTSIQADIDNLLISDSSLFSNDLEDFEEIPSMSDPLTTRDTNFEDRNRKVLNSLYLGDQIQALFNVSRINCLDTIESLMILGVCHVYLIDNYFYCPDGNVVDIDEAPQDSRDPYLQPIKPKSGSNDTNDRHRTRSWNLDHLACVTKRKFLLRNIALELFFNDGASILITCSTQKQRDQVYGRIYPYAKGGILDKDLETILRLSSLGSDVRHESSTSILSFRSRLASAFTLSFSGASTIFAITEKWQKGQICNFYYLMALNTVAGRTYNDLTQYPVFPWVIADYQSEELNLNDPKTFRDFSKPMGAQTKSRATEFSERYDALNGMSDSPAFHYGTHYSSAMIVASYLIRLRPYVQSYLLLQGGRFDHADRLFNSIEKAWSSASAESTTDVRELIPEFFYLPEFLENSNDFELGTLQTGEAPNDVKLPKWAKGDPKIFVAKHREALESPYVSAHLHEWIDLIFGYKQNGQPAVDSLNVFHHLSYDGAINLDSISDDTERQAVIGMINNFGQTPQMLFPTPHPPREILNIPNDYLLIHDGQSAGFELSFESKLKLPIKKLEFSEKNNRWIGRPSCTSAEDGILIRKPTISSPTNTGRSLVIDNTLFMDLHLTRVTELAQLGNKFFLTGCEAGEMHIWKVSKSPHLTLTFHDVLRGHLSAISSVRYNKAFNVCISVDVDGELKLWDMTRSKLIRNLMSRPKERTKTLVSVSNDTGNYCVVRSSRYSNVLSAYTLNGLFLAEITLGPGSIGAVAIAQSNDSLVHSIKSEYRHSYWSREYIVVGHASSKRLEIYELVIKDEGWQFQLRKEIELKALGSSMITALEVFKAHELDSTEKLSRAHLKFIVGTSNGRVYVL